MTASTADHSARSADLIDESAYAYMLALSEAIEDYTQNRLNQNLLAFRYRGMDLRMVIERWLYFALVNDDRLCAAYRGLKDGETLPPEQLPIPACWLLPFIGGPRVRRAWFSPLVGLLRSVPERMMRKRPPDPQKVAIEGVTKAHRVQVLFHVGALKFQRYLTPVIKSFMESACFLTFNDVILHRQIAETDAAVIGIDGSNVLTEVGYVTPQLRNWLSVCRDYDSALLGLRETGCSQLVIAEGNSAQHELLSRAAEALNIRTTCIQQGWSPIIHSGFRRMNYDAICVWGQQFANELRTYSPTANFVVTGSFILNGDHEERARHDAIGFFLQKNSRLITEAAWQEMLALIVWTAKAYPELTILVREHPGEPLTEAELERLRAASNIRLAPPQTMGLAETLSQCRIAVSIFSTTLIEAAGSGVLPLVYNLTGMPRYLPDLEAMGAGLEVRSSRAAREAIGRLLGKEGDDMLSRLDEIGKALFARRGKPALQAIMQAISA